MRPYKVFFLEMYHDGTVGGSHSILFNTTTNLDHNIFDITVGFFHDNLYTKKYKNRGIKVIILPEFKPSTFKLALIRKMINWYRLVYARKRYFQKLFKEKEYQLVVLNNTLKTAPPYIKACKNNNIPIIIYERGLNNYSKNEIKHSKYVSYSIPMSDAIMKSVVEQGVQSKHILRIYDGIDEEKIVPKIDKKLIKKELNIPDKSRVVGIVGNVKPWKGQEFFVKAMIRLCKKYDDLYAIIAGAWKDKDLDYKNNLDDLIKRDNLEGRILFTGYRTDVNNLLGAMDIFVHASIKPEPFGMVVPEAMSAKVPVIATNFGGPVESLDGGKCGILVDPKNSDQIFDACEKYLTDNEFSNNIVSRAYSRFNKEFRLDKTIELTSSIYISSIENEI